MPVSILSRPIAGAALILSLAVPALADGLAARVNTDTVAMGDTFQLQLTLDDQNGATPDLAPLAQDFDVLGASQSLSTQSINGRVSQSISWIVTLAPKSRGTLEIPALTAGAASSDPVQVEVLDASHMPKSANVAGISVSASVEDGQHFLFQETPLTVRIETALPLTRAELVAPTSPDFELEQRGADRSSRINRNGQQVTVIERDYLLRPQTEGQVEVPSFVLRGAVQDPNARNHDPFADMGFGNFPGFGRMPGFGGSLFDEIVNPGKPFQVRSETLALEVQANPTGENSGWFLPAKAVELRAAWEPENPIFRQGEAVTRRISVLALGARPEQLPDLDFTTPEGARIYVDDDRTGMADTPEGTVAQRDILISVVPTRGGQITLPEISVNWTDSETGEARVANLPAETIQAEGRSAPNASVPAASTSEISANPAPTTQRVPTHLPWIGAAVPVLFLLVGGLIWYRKRRIARAGSAQATTARRADPLERAAQLARDGDQRGCYGAVLDWRRKASAGGQLSDVAKDAVSALERACFADEPGADTPELIKIVALLRTENRRLARSNRSNPALPALYPT